MKALRIHGIGDLRLHDELVPAAGDDEYLIRVTAVGLCGSDVHWYDEAGIGDACLKEPLVLGHEFAGIIDSGDQQGQKVAVDPAIACRQCRYCEEGNPNFCDNCALPAMTMSMAHCAKRFVGRRLWCTNCLMNSALLMARCWNRWGLLCMPYLWGT